MSDASDDLIDWEDRRKLDRYYHGVGQCEPGCYLCHIVEVTNEEALTLGDE